MENKILKEKYASYYKAGKVNINNFINGINKKNSKQLREMYNEICKEERDFLVDIKIYNQKLQNIQGNSKSKEQLEDIEFDINWCKRRLEFVKIKKDILQRELDEIELQK